jgi:hypothetical protein
MRFLPAVALLALLAGPSPAQEPAPAKKKTRADHLAALVDTVVHFDFKRAPLVDITEALALASKVRIRIGKKAMQALERRRFKMKYIADRRGDKVLTDLAKAAALDFFVSDEGVYFDVPKEIRRLRKKLGIKGKSLELTKADVTRMLTTKTISLAAHEQSLSEVLEFLRKETRVRIVLTADVDAKLTLTATATPLGELLDRICEPHGLDWLQQGNVLMIDLADEIARHKKADVEKHRKKEQD